MNWVLVILRFLLGLSQPADDPKLQPIAVRPDGTTCHPDAEDDSWLPVSCLGWLTLRTRWLSLDRADELGSATRLHDRSRHRRLDDRQRSSLE